MKQIPLTQGKIALVDDEDYERLNRHRWYAQKSRYTYYAVRKSSRKQGKQRTIYMHKEILDIPLGFETDHKNHFGLDNRKANIRSCTRGENQHNRRQQNGASKYKGVTWYKGLRKWQAQIRFDGKTIHLGQFYLEIDAARTYDRKAKELFGEFAHTNF